MYPRTYPTLKLVFLTTKGFELHYILYMNQAIEDSRNITVERVNLARWLSLGIDEI